MVNLSNTGALALAFSEGFYVPNGQASDACSSGILHREQEWSARKGPTPVFFQQQLLKPYSDKIRSTQTGNVCSATSFYLASRRSILPDDNQRLFWVRHHWRTEFNLRKLRYYVDQRPQTRWQWRWSQQTDESLNSENIWGRPHSWQGNGNQISLTGAIGYVELLPWCRQRKLQGEWPSCQFCYLHPLKLPRGTGRETEAREFRPKHDQPPSHIIIGNMDSQMNLQ